MDSSAWASMQADKICSVMDRCVRSGQAVKRKKDEGKKDEGKKKKAAKSMDQMETQAYDIQGRFVGPITGFFSRPFHAGDLDDLLKEFEDTIPEAVWIQSLMPPCIPYLEPQNHHDPLLGSLSCSFVD